jgi:hypothetical protein
MALPPEIANGLYVRSGRVKAKVSDIGGHSQITGNNVTRYSAWGNCTHVAAGGGANTPCYQITDNDPRNFLFVADKQGGVGVGIVPNMAINIYVLSDNYGGCEWHVLSRNDHSAAAFLHVYRGGGVTAGYNLAGGWTHRGTLQSSNVGVQANSSIVSFAYVAGGSNVAECCFMRLNNQGMVIGVHEYQQVPI